MADSVTISWCKMPSGAGAASDVAVVTISSPPVNALNAAVRRGLLNAVQIIDAHHREHGSVFAVILHGSGRCFVAGGDLTEFDGPAPPPHLPDVIHAIERATVPWLALMHGAVLGGGVEVALGCAWRLATAVGATFGMPETNVGVIPGAGGTQRLPRLVGAERAAQMVAANKRLDAHAALAAGLVDGIVDHDEPDGMLADALDFLATGPVRPTPLAARPFPIAELSAVIKLRDDLRAKAPQILAPLTALDVTIDGASLSFPEAQAAEREVHLSLRSSAQSKALRHVFFAERQVGVLPPSSNSSAPTDSAVSPINKMTVVGGGLMGCGIAYAGLLAGLDVCVIDRDDESLAAAEARFQFLFDGAEKRGKITASGRAEALQRLALTADYESAADSDLAIEAVFEDLAAKQTVFANLAAVMRSTAIIATNTSYLNPDDIAAGIDNPGRIVGLHFFSPAHVMKLLEVIRCAATSPIVLAACFAFAKRLRKTAVLAGICDGFIGNRMLMAYRRQADYMLADGAMPEQIDGALESLGLPMGPFRMQDASGLQIAWANRQRQATTRPSNQRYVTIADSLCEMGRFGQRTGAGWYRYDGSRAALPDPIVADLIAAYPGKKYDFDDAIIRDRMFAAMVNEGLALLAEGIATRPLDIDMVKILGYGFPRYLGGPMHYAGHLGFDRLRNAFDDVMAQSPDSWNLAPQFDALAAGRISLAELNGDKQ